jgi:hypothetical protein
LRQRIDGGAMLMPATAIDIGNQGTQGALITDDTAFKM